MSNSNRHFCMRNEHWIFTKTSLHLVRKKIFEWIKFLRRHSYQIQGNWASRNVLTASRVNSRLIRRARSRDESIYTTNGFNFLIMESWGYAWPGLTVKSARKMTSSVSKDAVSKIELSAWVHCWVSVEGGWLKPRLRYFQSQSNSFGLVKPAHSFACNHWNSVSLVKQ